MKNYLANLIFIIFLSIILNFNSFLMGSDSNILNILTTAIYLISFSIFIVNSKNNKKNLTFSIIWNIFVLICAIGTLIVNIKQINLDFMIPFAIVFLTPFYALESFFNKTPFLFFSILIMIISLIFIVGSYFYLIRLKRN